MRKASADSEGGAVWGRPAPAQERSARGAQEGLPLGKASKGAGWRWGRPTREREGRRWGEKANAWSKSTPPWGQKLMLLGWRE